MLKKYSFLFSFLIIVLSTIFLNISVYNTIKIYADIENIACDTSENAELPIEKQEETIVNLIDFQFDIALCNLSIVFNTTEFSHIQNVLSSIDSPPPDIV